MQSHLVRHILRTVRQHNLFGPGSSLVLAVSGGADSVCLLSLLNILRQQWDLELTVAHFDHALRGEESEKDADFVSQLSRDLGLKCLTARGNVREFAAGKGLCIQEAARILRYDFLKEARIRTGSQYIATAHTADDQAEEVLLRLIRGASLSGLSGIPWVREGNIVRPLLDVTRRRILDYLNSNNIPFVEDSSNSSSAYVRNRIRNELIPHLTENFNPSILKTLSRTARLLREENELLQETAEKAYRLSAISGDPESHGKFFSVEKILLHPAPIRRRVYRIALKELDLFNGRYGSSHLEAIDYIVTSSKPNSTCRLPGAYAIRCYNELLLANSESTPLSPCVRPYRPQSPEFMAHVSGPGSWNLPADCGIMELSLCPSPDAFAAKKSGSFDKQLWIDPSAVTFPLYLRMRKPGDRFWPLGAKGTCKLKKFLISRKIPRDVRGKLPLLINDGAIVAVVGVEIAHPYRLRNGKGSAFSIRWVKKQLTPARDRAT